MADRPRRPRGRPRQPMHYMTIEALPTFLNIRPEARPSPTSAAATLTADRGRSDPPGRQDCRTSSVPTLRRFRGSTEPFCWEIRGFCRPEIEINLVSPYEEEIRETRTGIADGVDADNRAGGLRDGTSAGHDQGRRPAFAFGHDGHQRNDAEGHRPDDD